MILNKLHGYIIARTSPNWHSSTLWYVHILYRQFIDQSFIFQLYTSLQYYIVYGKPFSIDLVAFGAQMLLNKH
jgi:hypothetical protein